MPAPYSEDLRIRAVKYYERYEVTQEQVCEQFSFSLPSFRRYWKRYKETGKVAPITGKGGRPSAIDKQGQERIKVLVSHYSDSTLEELCEHYNRNRKHKIGSSVMHRYLNQLNVRRKKKSFYACEADRPDVKKSVNPIKRK